MNHYDWLEENLPKFFSNLGLVAHDCRGLITAHGDKCYSAERRFEEIGLHFYHGCALYLLLQLPPYSEQVRETKDGWVDPIDWIFAHKDDFLPYLPEIQEGGLQNYEGCGLALP